MVYEDEILIDEDVKFTIDGHVLSWDRLEAKPALGGVGYHIAGKPFAILLEGMIAMDLPDVLRDRALTLAGVSPFRSPADDDELKHWVQFLLLLPEDVPTVVPWLESAYNYVGSKLESQTGDES